ncbi:CapA family protein [Rhodobacteraceae bacterium N5(2021)]|uniref:CapA family protein n=1 Tax=Gymnodinialimonas phycosphaerae TaxID=2841589 RepID=A0A975TXF5_9RHOB|nr:CapA family protein [Gymnodinialimonas phycosphaerae]MBY4892746.1 CapA family protein [Gymnodinialimonas phycosphaerae]
MLNSFKNNRFGRKLHVRLKAAAVLLAITSCAPTSQSGTCGRPDLAFGGDVLLHSLIQSDAAARTEGFAPAFAPLGGALSRALVTSVNLEGPAARNIAPSGREVPDPGTLFDGHIYSGYPRFNYHPSIAGVLASVGVDVVQTANNHAMDRGAIGADRTLSALAAAGLATTGTHPRGATATWHTTRQVAGYNIAFLACTFSTNGLADPGGQALRCYGNQPSIPTLIHTLNTQPGIDGVVLLPHWGTEYSARPTARQRTLARAAAEAGAIAIVGAHPHVLQPLETIVTSDGRRVPVAFSLGNLISSQWQLAQRTGAILYLDLSATAQGLEATGARYLPTRVERTTEQGVAVFPAASLATGAASLAHAQRILGPGMVTPDGCLAP